jgi:pyridoxal phosphate enzyme (YggS family)
MQNTISSNIEKLKSTLPADVQLLAVSKYSSVEQIMEAYSAGQRCFAESRPQALSMKAELLPKDIQWHFIGHLQRNKVKQVLQHSTLIHSVDNTNLMLEIEKEAIKQGKPANCLLQIHIAQEETKFGFSLEELNSFFENANFANFSNINFCGMMAMASNTDDLLQVRQEFAEVKGFFDQIKIKYFVDNADFNTLSMGMSNDYNIAIEEGSTMIRLGSAIFGD